MRSAAYAAITDAPGAAPWLVMVHGFSQDRRAFGAQRDAFRDRYRLVLVDLPGHGASSALPGPYGHAELADAVAGALDSAIGASTPCAFWGTHTGAAVALLLAARDAARFSALVLEGAVLPGRPMPSVAQSFARLQRVALEQGVDTARRLWFDESPWFAVMRERPVECRAAEQCAMIDGFTGRPWLEPGAPAPVEVSDARLAAIDCPVLLYNGMRDVPDFVAAAGHLARILPRATRLAIEDAGGFPAWEFPARVNAAVAAFLDARLAARGA